ncbi:MAG: hypothetical protein JJ992_25995, partial [Planctomycetes bacterium]|nr:hypothetical protein [Planctomycetota bacterium]
MTYGVGGVARRGGNLRRILCLAPVFAAWLASGTTADAADAVASANANPLQWTALPELPVGGGLLGLSAGAQGDALIVAGGVEESGAVSEAEAGRYR